MTFYADDKAPTPGEITLEDEALEEVIAPKITSNRAVILACNGLELGFEEPEAFDNEAFPTKVLNTVF